MRYYSYNEYNDVPDCSGYVVTFREEEIRATYYPYWYGKMCDKFGKEIVDNNYSFEDCLKDWVDVNWAWEVEGDV